VQDFAEFNEEENSSFGMLTRGVYAASKSLTKAERIYQASMIEGIPHFHAWLIPRGKEDKERGVTFLEKDVTCKTAEAEELAVALRHAMQLPG
jgi:diadenosine tetraphosphate (Ap4A) HIT family hydrolase